MLRLQETQQATLWDSLFPAAAEVLPDDLARLHEVLGNPAVLAPFQAHWERQEKELERSLSRFGRPTIAMATYLRLMVVKHRTGWGYETLVKEVSDSFHLRRFCLIPLHADVPHESTVRKLTRRLGSELTDELIRELFRLAIRERRFRPRAMRSDSTVIEADIRYPTDSGLAADAVGALARAARKVRAAVPDASRKVRDRTRTVGKLLRQLGRTLRRRTGEAKAEVERLTKAAAAKVEVSLKEARKLVAQARQSKLVAVGVSEQTRQRAIEQLVEMVSHSERVVEQVRRRFAGEKIPDRLVSLFDPDARPVRRGKLSQPTQFGSVVQVTEVTSHTGKGARGLILPPKLQAGSTTENTLLPETVNELVALDLHLKAAVFDGGFTINATTTEMARTAAMGAAEPEVFIVGSHHNQGSHRHQRRLARYRVGAEGRISHLKRGYGVRRSHLKGTQGARTWTGWAAFSYNADTIIRMGLPR